MPLISFQDSWSGLSDSDEDERVVHAPIAQITENRFEEVRLLRKISLLKDSLSVRCSQNIALAFLTPMSQTRFRKQQLKHVLAQKAHPNF